MAIETMSIAQVCERLGCKRSQVFRLLAKGKLERAPLLGRSLRVRTSSVDRALAPPKRRRRGMRGPDELVIRIEPPRVESLSVDQVSEKLGCGRSRVFELLRDGTLIRAPRFGRQIRILGWSVDRALMPPPPEPRKPRRRKQRFTRTDWDAVHI